MVKVFSKEQWNDAEIDLIKGRKYKYNAKGEWIDWFIKCDADGYPKILNFFMDVFLRGTKRTPSAKWFQLVGVINKNTSHTINLGKIGTFTALEDGRLWVFANDANSAYWNNCGSVNLELKELD
jgi:hypothetical protein